MTLLEALDKNLIRVPLSSADGNGVIEELVSLFSKERNLSPEEENRIADSIKEREALGSTAMENGIAIPHARIEGLDKSAVVIGISRLPVAFGAADGSGTKVFFLVLAPKDNPSEHVQILSSIAKAASSQLFVRMLLSSKTKDDVYQLFFE